MKVKVSTVSVKSKINVVYKGSLEKYTKEQIQEHLETPELWGLRIEPIFPAPKEVEEADV